MTTKVAILRSARSKRGKTKRELADAAGIGYSQAAKVVNDLILQGELITIGKLKSRAELFTRRPSQIQGVSLIGKPRAETA